jgi:hypothetical protein
MIKSSILFFVVTTSSSAIAESKPIKVAVLDNLKYEKL